MRRFWQSVAALFVLATILAIPASSQIPFGGTVIGKVAIDQTTPGTTNGVATATSAVTGSVSGKTITNASTQTLAAAPRQLLAIRNQSSTATISCAFGIAAVIGQAGGFDMVPGSTTVWNSYPVPADAVNCISSAATSPATVEAN